MEIAQVCEREIFTDKIELEWWRVDVALHDLVLYHTIFLVPLDCIYRLLLSYPRPTGDEALFLCAKCCTTKFGKF